MIFRLIDTHNEFKKTFNEANVTVLSKKQSFNAL